MKALSVRQPWAFFLINGEKSIEWRSWQTKHRGDLLICASSRRTAGIDFPDIDPAEIKRLMPLGVAIGVVSLVDVHPFGRKDISAALMEEIPDPPGFAWMIENPRKIEPFPVKGKLHLFEVDYEIM